MARPSHAELISRYSTQIGASKKYREREGYDQTWKRLVDLYRGKQFDSLSNEDRIAVNISFSTVNVIAPSISVNHPKITVNARKPSAAAQAEIAEAVTNYWWRHYYVRPQFRRAVKDFLIIGHGWLKCGYKYSEKVAVQQAPQPIDNVPLAGVDQTTAPNDQGDQTMTAVEGEREETNADPISSEMVVVETDRPFVERLSPFDVFVDPDATGIDDARWIAQRIRRLVSDVKADNRFDLAARKQVGAAMQDRLTHPAGATTPRRIDKDTNLEYVDIWEFYDIPGEKMCVFAEGADKFLVKPQPMPYSFGHPFVMIRNYDIPDYFYPMGDLEALEPLQRELNATRTQMMNHRKKYSRKYLYKESAFDPKGRKALESDEDNALVPVVSDEPLGNAVAPFPTVMTPPEFYNHTGAIMNDVNTISAVSEYMRGGAPDIRRTATEAAITQDAANARAADKLATIEEAISEVAKRLVALAQQFMTGEQVARIQDQDGQPVWVTFDRDYIEGEFDFEVEAGSTAPVNESFRRQMALQMVDAMSPFVQLGVVNPLALATHVLKFGFGVKNPNEFLQGQQGMAPPAPDQGGMPAGMPPDDGQPPMPPSAPPGAPGAPSGVDPAVLQALQSKVGLSLNNTGM